MMSSPIVRASSVLFAFAAISVASTTAQAQWTAVSLLPPDARYAHARGGRAGQQVGYGGLLAHVSSLHAGLWSGTAESWMDLHPAGFTYTFGLATDGVQQVGGGNDGVSQHEAALLWSGTAASVVNLQPNGMGDSVARGVDAGQQVGSVRIGENGPGHAALWQGTAASWVDLNPQGAIYSVAFGVHAGRQVGYAHGSEFVAAMWTGTAASFQSLHPPGRPWSTAYGIRGDQQVGEYGLESSSWSGACLWQSTAASWVDLHPTGAIRSVAVATNGEWQVGWQGSFFIAGTRACIWHGSRESVVDLTEFLPAGYTNSEAYDIWVDAGSIFVVGTASGAGLQEIPILWSRPLAAQDRCVEATPIAQWLETDGAADDEFGRSVAISGDTAVLGAPRDDDGGSSSGSVYVYVRTQGVWTLQQKLTASDAAANDQFGFSVAVSGNTIIVGAHGDDNAGGSDAGAAYVFVRATGESTWTLQQKIIATDGQAGNQFGYSVSIWSGYIVAGAQGDDDAGSASGSAYVFLRSGTTWTQQAKLLASDGAVSDLFGQSVAISRETVIVGAFGEDTNAGNINRGAAYIFLRTGSAWAQQAKLNASDAASNDLFGVSVAIEDDTAVIGANSDDLVGVNDAGSVYVFKRANVGFPPVPTWTQQQKLTAGDAAASDGFGSSVAIIDDRAIVGATGDDTAAGAQAGSVYVFDRSGSTWSQTHQLFPADPGASDTFGGAVALSSTTVLASAPGDDTPEGVSAGSGHVFTLGGGNWSQQAKLVANGSTLDPMPYFGGTVAIDGDVAVASVIRRGDGGNGLQHGMAYVFERKSGIWVHTATLDPAEGLEGFAAAEIIAIDIDNDTIVTGTMFATATPFGIRTGAAFVYTRSPSGVWSLQQRLVPFDGSEFEYFGISVAVFGNTLVVGSLDSHTVAFTNEGSAYVFTRSGNAWTTQQKLVAPFPQVGAEFGRSVAISYDTIVIGEDRRTTQAFDDSGAAYIFSRAPGATTWTMQSALLPPEPSEGLLFGRCVAIDRETVVIGASGAALGGRAFVYALSGTDWLPQQELSPAEILPNTSFGAACAVLGDTIVIGAEASAASADSRSRAYVFARGSGGSVWAERARLQLADQADADGFGLSVAVDRSNLLVGARVDTTAIGANSGSVHLFRLDSTYSPAITSHPVSATACISGQTSFSVAAAGTPPLTYLWQLETVPGSDVWITVTNGFMPGIGTFDLSLPEVMVATALSGGLSLSLATRCIVTNDCGSAISNVATLAVCAADFDCDGIRAVPDIFAFLSAWFANDPAADIDGTPGIAVPDIFAFLSAWFAGCD